MNVETLRSVPLFESLDDDAADTICSLLIAEECDAGAYLFRAGDAGDSMYVIEDGKIQISMRSSDGEDLILAVLGPGDFFGEMALIDGKPRSANAKVVEHCRLAVLSRSHFLSFVGRSPNVAVEMLTALSRRLRRTDELLRHLATRNANEEEEAHLTFADRAADIIAEFGGSWKFIIFCLGTIALWVGMNTSLLTRRPFDAYPFILLNLALNVVTA